MDTHACIAALLVAGTAIKLMRFQSTHPLRGATRPRCAAAGHSRHFNPRTPCGVRRPPRATVCTPSPRHFNPRTPCGVRRAIACGRWRRICISIHADHAARCKRFQSTHPLRGATMRSISVVAISVDFNPRTPCGVRRVVVLVAHFAPGISIHAPREGCDRQSQIFTNHIRNFNPRTP